MKRKKKYFKNCKSALTKDMWYELAVLRTELGISKAEIIRRALEEFIGRYRS